MARQRVQTIRNFEELKAAYPSYANASMNQLLVDLTNSGFILAPQFYRQLQDFLMSVEVEKGIPVAPLAQQPQALPAAANAFDVGSPPLVTTHQAAAAAEGGGGGGGRGGGGGGGAAAMSAEEEFYWWKQQRDYEAQQAAAEAESTRQWQEEQDRIQREWQAEQDRIERENRLRLQRLGDLTGLVGQFAGIQARARETLAGLQGDPFKFAAAKQGLSLPGTTPMESFSGELSQFAGQAMPTIDPNAPLSAIEQQIMGLQGQMAPQAPKIFGMAGGGEVHGQEQTVLVGELGKPEIVVGTDFKVIPLTGSGGAGFDTSTLLPALRPLYPGGNVPTARRDSFGTSFWQESGGGGASSGSQLLGNLGYSPRYIRDQASGRIYYDRGDTLQPFSFQNNPASMGLNPADIANVNISEGYGRIAGPELTALPTQQGQLSAFGPLSSPIIEPVTGAILPAPYRAAAFLNQMRLQNPQMYQLALSAYANSISRAGDPNARLGYTQEGVEAEVRQALPFGQEHGLIGLR